MTTQQSFKDWPVKHGDEEAPQPWDLKGQNVSLDDQALEPGEPNNVTPIRLRHSHAILTTGAQGPEVAELARRLHLLGYKTSIGSGTNPYSVLTDDVMSAVESFREDYNVHEDPTGFGGTGPKARDKAAAHIGAWTWEALNRASDRALEDPDPVHASKPDDDEK